MAKSPQLLCAKLLLNCWLRKAQASALLCNKLILRHHPSTKAPAAAVPSSRGIQTVGKYRALILGHLLSGGVFVVVQTSPLHCTFASLARTIFCRQLSHFFAIRSFVGDQGEILVIVCDLNNQACCGTSLDAKPAQRLSAQLLYV